VGTTYKQQHMLAHLPRTYVLAPDELSRSERKSLAELFQQFGVIARAEEIGDDRNVLAALYRALPASRAKLAAGLSGEARAAEGVLRERSAKQDVNYSPLAQQIIALGLAPASRALESTFDDALSSADDSAARIIDFVMVAGRCGCPIPVDLLLRAAASGRNDIDYGAISQLFQDLDLFRWRESGDAAEELLISPRLILEAELICRRRTLDARNEGEIIVDLIEAARLSDDFAGTERRFLLDLIHQMGPNGSQRDRYKESYIDAGRALTRLRETRGVEDPSLMLQESYLRREAIRSDMVSEDEKAAILEEALKAVQRAIDNIRPNAMGRGVSRIRGYLVVERASLYGFLANDYAKRGSPPEVIWSAYEATRTAARTAFAITDRYHPLDVSLWVPADLLDLNVLTEPYVSELKADIFSVLDSVDQAALQPDQREKFNIRRGRIGDQLGATGVSEDAFRDLEAAGSTAGYYLRAHAIGPRLNRIKADDPSKEEMRKAAAAAEFLRRNWAKINQDERCLRYLLQCEWMSRVHRMLLRGPRAPLPAKAEDRASLYHLVQRISEISVQGPDNGLRYLEAVLAWLTNDDQHARETWRSLAFETDFIDPRRIVRRNLVTDQSGAPLVYSGRIEDETEPGRFTVRVEQTGKKIIALASDFDSYDLSRGRMLSTFAIAFNYIGPIADPLVRRKDRRP
jgi:hypothetical protein